MSISALPTVTLPPVPLIPQFSSLQTSQSLVCRLSHPSRHPSDRSQLHRLRRTRPTYHSRCLAQNFIAPPRGGPSSHVGTFTTCVCLPWSFSSTGPRQRHPRPARSIQRRPRRLPGSKCAQAWWCQGSGPATHHSEHLRQSRAWVGGKVCGGHQGSAVPHLYAPGSYPSY